MRNIDPNATTRSARAMRKGAGTSEKTCHISVLMNSTAANSSSSGTARASDATLNASSDVRLSSAPRRICGSA